MKLVSSLPAGATALHAASSRDAISQAASVVCRTYSRLLCNAGKGHGLGQAAVIFLCASKCSARANVRQPPKCCGFRPESHRTCSTAVETHRRPGSLRSPQKLHLGSAAAMPRSTSASAPRSGSAARAIGLFTGFPACRARRRAAESGRRCRYRTGGRTASGAHVAARQSRGLLSCIMSGCIP